ncbi:MAG: DUF1156 domain-containing protein [Kiritimatiellae bacterium]|nr:DUF1156 domain-containing protein [Kiritimatiellia bacterium]
MKAPKKLIEVALPLKAINEACAREKSIRHGHPSTLHLWWARRPLAAARAVIFSQMVNDPLEKYGANPTPQQRSAATKERERLFKIIEELVKWENTNNEAVLKKARKKILESWRETCEMNKGEPGFDPDKLPAFHDPFAGGGALPLEAQRLGLEAYASDLNPVAVMINKAMIEIPPKFAGRKPVGPIPPAESAEAAEMFDGKWPGATGLAEDVRRYGYWMREEAKKRIRHLYPQVTITKDMAKKRPDLKQYVGRKLTVIAWLWARTVKSPHPAFSHVDVPLVSSFVLSSKKGKEAWVKPIVSRGKWHFEVCVGKPPKGAEFGTTLGKRKAFRCILTDSPVSYDYIRDFGKNHGLGQRMFAVVLDGPKGRIYIEPPKGMEELAKSMKPTRKPMTPLPDNPRDFKTPNYGLTTYGDLFTDRQLTALNTFSDLVQEARQKVIADCGDEEYANAITVYLTFAVDKIPDRNSSLCGWDSSRELARNVYGRQAIPMVWDFAEGNVFSESSGCFANCITWIEESLINLPTNTLGGGANQADAQTQVYSLDKVISTDPPYYDNIGYADLSDFFYIWMRRGLKGVYPELFSTMTTPKNEELVATPYRHGGKEVAESFFMDGMTAAMHNLGTHSNSALPVTIYYAFKQSETNDSGTRNAGWETFLEAVIMAGFSITGTWPMRTELANRMIGSGTNALASSIVLVCRKRSEDATEITRRKFLRELKAKMPGALADMRGGDAGSVPVAPVDMAQAAIGPGMEIYSKYKAVLNADGSRMSVHDAIIEINRFLDEGDDFDAETQFCRDWFKEHLWKDGQSGEADVLARAKGLSVARVVDAGVLVSQGGKTRLVHWQDYPEDYDPEEDTHRPVWEVCHHLVRIHQRHGTGEAGKFLSMVTSQGEAARQLAYLLYTICERKGLADEARVYNELARGWGDILTSSIENPSKKLRQAELGI